jgi:hypothetical protein
MAQSLASRRDSPALAAAMSRHPASGGPAAVTALSEAALPGPGAPSAVPGPASFATVAALLTGPWRVDDPVGFAAAMRAAPLVAGHAVVDARRLAPVSGGHPLPPGVAFAHRPPAGLDPHSAAVAGHLESAVAAAAGRAGLAVRWVAARAGSDLYVEAAARAPADGDGPELLVLGHVVEPLAGAPAADDSWLVAVVGDGRGGVAGVVRAALDGRLPVRLRLGALRARLAAPALAAEGLGPRPSEASPEGVVLPFRR